MLIVAEAAGLGEGAEYTIRTLLSENKLILKTVNKDLRGRNASRTMTKEGPTGLILTTTKPRLNLENETRYLSIGLDESEEQSQRVKDATAKRWQGGAAVVDLDAWVNAQRLLEPVEVQIPFADFLSQRTPQKPLRIRRDFEKLLQLIGASATLHQIQRRKLGTNANGTKIIEASIVDYFYVKELFEKLFFQSLYGIHPNTRKVMDAIKKLYRDKNNGAKPDPKTGFVVEVLVTTKDLADELGVSKTSVLEWAKPLDQYGWVIEGGDGKANEYRLGIEPDPKKSVLPSVDEVIGNHPELLAMEPIEAVHPLTGKKVMLGEKAHCRALNGSALATSADPSQARGVGEGLPKGTIVCGF